MGKLLIKFMLIILIMTKIKTIKLLLRRTESNQLIMMLKDNLCMKIGKKMAFIHKIMLTTLASK